MRQTESKLQQECVKWFRYQYPKYAKLLIAVPNGGKRNIATASRLKAEGVVPGVADLLLLVASNGFNYLAIEMKSGKGNQTPLQKEWEEVCVKNGGYYYVCNSFDIFKGLIEAYL